MFVIPTLILISTRLLTLAAVLESPEVRILSNVDFKEQESPVITSPLDDEVNLSNKTSKILTGPSRLRPGASYGQGQPDGWGYLSSQGSGNKESVQNHPSLSAIDMQLLSGMEKLVSKMNGLENRVNTLERIVHFLTGKDKPADQHDVQQRGSCPVDFQKIDGIKSKCFHISSFAKSSRVTDWKTAAAECGRLGGRLAEMLSFSDFHRLVSYLGKYTNTRNAIATDFWTGGLNPGLIWIWSESGQQIDLDKRYWNDNDNSSNAPGCLKLSYSVRLNTFFFKGAPCSQSQNYVCEVLDNSVSRALATFERDLTRDDPNQQQEDERNEDSSESEHDS